MSSPTRDCAMFFTHTWSPRIAGHYARLQREAGSVLDVVLCCNLGAATALPEGMTPDVVVSDAEAWALFPARFAQMQVWGKRRGYFDLAWLAAFLDPRLGAYERFWMVEFDVDFSGDWADFFGPMAGVEADLLATHYRHRSTYATWNHWGRHRQPAEAPADPLTSFFPLGRFSRRLVEDFRDTVASGDWDGHNESVLTSIALAHGLTVEEISGDTAFTPPERKDLFYVNGVGTVGPNASTFEFQPPRAYSYFEERPRGFRQRNKLYHPVKVDEPLGQRLWYLEMTVRRFLKRQ